MKTTGQYIRGNLELIPFFREWTSRKEQDYYFVFIYNFSAIEHSRLNVYREFFNLAEKYLGHGHKIIDAVVYIFEEFFRPGQNVI